METRSAPMELRVVDPRTLAFSKENPRRRKADPVFDQQLAQNIAALGLLQLPVVRDDAGTLTITAGERRVRAVLSLDWPELQVLVCNERPEHDHARAISENVVRAGMNEVDTWRSISALVDQGWTMGGVCGAFGLSEKQLGQLQLLSRILPAMLDLIAVGKGPNPKERATIANATLEEQAAVWKKHKPKKGEPVYWHIVANALRKQRIPFETAAFDAATAERYGICWTNDLFASGDEDGRFTEDCEAFLLAQTEWMETHLPRNGEVLSLDEYGQPQLPKKAERVWGKPGKGDRIGFAIDPRTYEIAQVPFRMPEAAAKTKGAKRDTDAADGTEGVVLRTSTRAEVSGTGVTMIGSYRTDALRATVVERAETADPWQLVGALVMAFAGKNLRLDTGWGGFQQERTRQAIASSIAPDGFLTSDVATLRLAAGAMLAQVLNCEDGARGSGVPALVVGQALGADAHLPNMAHEEFLKTLSKDGVTRAVQALGVAPRNTGKEMRAALIRHVGEGLYHHPKALFALAEDEKQTIGQWGVVSATMDEAEDAAPDGDDPDAEGDESVERLAA